MPLGDRTGPRGEGPLTGRGLGECAGYRGSGYAFGRGYGGGYGFRGRGGGRGWRNRYYETGLPGWYGYPQNPPYERPFYSRERSETESLKRQGQFIADTIDGIASHINQLLERKNEKE